jgi:diguanylate cyclase (GGDEF)-like protein
MRIVFNRLLGKYRSILTVSTGVTLFVAALSYLGALQSLELGFYDAFMRSRPPEVPDRRIVLVTVDEATLTRLPQWPLSDADLARAIETIAAQSPDAIGLNLYRNVPVNPGSERWQEVARQTENLIGVEKIGFPKVDPPQILADLDRAAFVDVPIDLDQRQRRAFLSVRKSDLGNRGESSDPDLPSNIRLSFAMQLSKIYLDKRGTHPKIPQSRQAAIPWGKAHFQPLMGYEGGYAYGSVPGYQILLDYRGLQPDDFTTISLEDVLNNRVPTGLFNRKIVLLGTTAISLENFLYTPYTYGSISAEHATPSLYIQANIISQIISAVIDGREFLRAAKPTIVLLWIWVWAIGFNLAYWAIVMSQAAPKLRPGSLERPLLLGAAGTSLALIVTSYICFLNHLWLPTVAPILAGLGAGLIILTRQRSSFARLATTDGLTKLANRRYFDVFLNQCWNYKKTRGELSLLLCDVDFFKRYNDTYGHQAGDVCLATVAQVLADAVRKSDLVARYGGEEFAIVMPYCSIELAERIADKICRAIYTLNLEHRSSEAADRVTISCGIASTSLGIFAQPYDLIEEADRALYLAKKEGRNCYRVLYSFASPPSTPSTSSLPVPHSDSETGDD